MKRLKPKSKQDATDKQVSYLLILREELGSDVFNKAKKALKMSGDLSLLRLTDASILINHLLTIKYKLNI